MKRAFTICFAILLTVTLFASCKKEKKTEEPTATKPDVFQILMSKEWKPAVNDKTPNLKPTGTSTYFAPQQCKLDDIFIFSANGVLTVNSGADRCNNGGPGGQPATEANTYSYNKETNQLNLDGITYQVLEINKDQIKVYLATPQPTGFSNLIFLYQ